MRLEYNVSSQVASVHYLPLALYAHAVHFITMRFAIIALLSLVPSSTPLNNRFHNRLLTFMGFVSCRPLFHVP